MIIVSARKTFWNSNRLAETVNDRVRDIDLESSDLSGANLSPTQFRQRIAGRNILLLVHGYNNERLEVARAYAEIERRAATAGVAYDDVIGYTWPGGDDRFDYFAAKDRAGAVSRRLCKTLELLLTSTNRVGVMSHSMGCRLVFLVMQDLERRTFARQAGVVTFNMASAVDNESIEIGRRYHRATTYVDQAHIFHSKRDKVLATAYRVAELDNALGLRGPEDPARIENQVKVVNCKRVVGGHGGYKRSDEVFDHVGLVASGVATPQFSSL